MIQYACGAIAFCISCLAHANCVERILFKYWEFEGRDQIAYSVMFGAVLTPRLPDGQGCLAKAICLYEHLSQFGLALSSVSFLLDWDHANGVRKYKSPLPARGRRVAETRRVHELANNGTERSE